MRLVEHDSRGSRGRGRNCCCCLVVRISSLAPQPTPSCSSPDAIAAGSLGEQEATVDRLSLCACAAISRMVATSDDD
ncbi:unnamed protein product [Soboliphyme baturini]|uniref:Uncharacterized protein n=1 Tax=Soboliphyme baturini TaxID=241478 RepID=A0A183J1V0_9BILA|nr:unnamed protein product [Soboliphyme baturini]